MQEREIHVMQYETIMLLKFDSDSIIFIAIFIYIIFLKKKTAD